MRDPQPPDAWARARHRAVVYANITRESVIVAQSSLERLRARARLSSMPDQPNSDDANPATGNRQMRLADAAWFWWTLAIVVGVATTFVAHQFDATIVTAGAVVSVTLAYTGFTWMIVRESRNDRRQRATEIAAASDKADERHAQQIADAVALSHRADYVLLLQCYLELVANELLIQQRPVGSAHPAPLVVERGGAAFPADRRTASHRAMVAQRAAH